MAWGRSDDRGSLMWGKVSAMMEPLSSRKNFPWFPTYFVDPVGFFPSGHIEGIPKEDVMAELPSILVIRSKITRIGPAGGSSIWRPEVEYPPYWTSRGVLVRPGAVYDSHLWRTATVMEVASVVCECNWIHQWSPLATIDVCNSPSSFEVGTDAEGRIRFEGKTGSQRGRILFRRHDEQVVPEERIR